MEFARMSLKGFLPSVRNVWVLRSPESQRPWACAGAGCARAITTATSRAVTVASARAARRLRDPFIFIPLLRTLIACRRRESDRLT
jgi:hypothetical protein